MSNYLNGFRAGERYGTTTGVFLGLITGFGLGLVLAAALWP